MVTLGLGAHQFCRVLKTYIGLHTRFLVGSSSLRSLSTRHKKDTECSSVFITATLNI